MFRTRIVAASLLLLAGPVALLAPAVLVAAQAPANASSADTLRSPEVLPDRRVVFRLYAPKATAVSLTGDWMDNNHRNASRPMTRDADGVWSITQGPLPADFYLYSFNVDGVATLDPKNRSIKSGPSALHNVFELPGPETAFQESRRVPHGSVQMIWYHSEVTGQMRRMHVYTPPSYSSGNARYPVLYLMHGGGDNDTGWTSGGRVNFILDNLVAERKARPMIVVMPDFNLNLPPLATPGSAMDIAAREQDAFTRELLTVIRPYVESNFRVIADREHRAIAGLSMGGARTLRIGPSNLDLFSYIGVFSMGLQKGPTQGVPDDFEQRNAAFLGNASDTNRRLKLLWIGVGNQDDRIYDGGKVLSETLNRHGIHNEYHESEGGHSWLNWRRYLNEFAPRLFQ